MSHPYQSRPLAATHVWLTPREILDPLGEFDLDPCGHRGWETAKHTICPPADGLAYSWAGRVWCNPPFGSQTAVWLKRMAQHGNGIALAFARTETQMFQQWVWPVAHGVLFLAGRPHFCRPDGTRAEGNSGGPVCLIAYGRENAETLRSCGIAGAFVDRAYATAVTP